MGRYKLLSKIKDIFKIDPYQDTNLFRGLINERIYLDSELYSMESFTDRLNDEGVYLISKSHHIKIEIKEIKHSPYTFSCDIYFKIIFPKNIFFIRRNEIPLDLYYECDEICPFCLSLMKRFDECAPIINTKIGSLIL